MYALRATEQVHLKNCKEVETLYNLLYEEQLYYLWVYVCDPQQKLQSLDYRSSPCTLEGGEVVPVSVYHICNSSTDFKIILCCMEEMHAAK